MQLSQTIQLDCPHCGIRKAAFILRGSYTFPGRASVVGTIGILQHTYGTYFYTCPKCQEGVCASAKDNEISDIYPKAEKAIPDHLPERVESYFRQGIDSLGESVDAAGMMFRKSLETALKNKFPETKGTLAQRIKQLAENASLTQDLADWADHIRIEGNDAAHDEFTESQAREMHKFTELVLTYLFTLPKIAKRANEERQARKT